MVAQSLIEVLVATVRQGSSFLGSYSQGCLKEASLASVTRSAGRLRFSQDPAGVSPGAATAFHWHDVRRMQEAWRTNRDDASAGRILYRCTLRSTRSWYRNWRTTPSRYTCAKLDR